MVIRKRVAAVRGDTGASADMSAIGLTKNLLPGRVALPLESLALADRWRAFQRRWFALDYETRFQYAVLASMLLHAFVLFGILMEYAGFVPALLVLIVGSALAGSEFKLGEVLLLAGGLTAFCVALFIWGLGLPYPLFVNLSAE